MKCPECHSDYIIDDNVHCERICRTCGFVLGPIKFPDPKNVSLNKEGFVGYSRNITIEDMWSDVEPLAEIKPIKKRGGM